MKERKTDQVGAKGKGESLGLQADYLANNKIDIALGQSLSLLDFHLKNTPLGVIEWDASYRVKRWMGQAEQIFGWSADEVLGRCLDEWRFIHEDDLASTRGVRDALVQSGCSQMSHLNRNYHKSGKVVYCHWYNSVFYDDDGSVFSVFSFVQDVTESQKVQSALLRERALLRLVVDSLPYDIYVKDREGRFVFANSTCFSFYGFSEMDGLLGKTDFDFFPADRAESFLLEDEKVMTRGDSIINFERMYELPSGRKSWWTTTKVPWYDADGSIIGLVGLNRDTTKEKQEESSRYQNEQMLRAIFDASDKMVALLEADGRIVMINRTGSAWLGREVNDLKGLCYYDMIPGSVADYRREQNEKILATRFPVRYEDRIESRWYDTSVYPVMSGDDEVIRLALFSRDVTSQKSNEIQIRKYQRQLRLLAGQLVETEERERRRVATLLHDDVGQFLAAAKIKLGVLSQTVGPGEVSSQVSEIRDFVDQAIEQTRELTCELCPPILYEVGLGAAIEWLLEHTRKLYGLEGRLAQCDFPLELESHISTMLYRAVQELVANVVKHSQATLVEVKMGVLNGRTWVTVSDDGVGFDVSRLGRYGRGEGGFGLFNIRERLKDAGGSVEIDTEKGSGTCVTLMVGRGVQVSS